MLQVMAINKLYSEYYNSNQKKFQKVDDFKNLLFNIVLEEYLAKILSYDKNEIDENINIYIDLLNDRFSQYYKYKLFPEEGEGTKDTFFWEISKLISASWGSEIFIKIYLYTLKYLTESSRNFIDKVFNKKIIEKYI